MREQDLKERAQSMLANQTWNYVVAQALRGNPIAQAAIDLVGDAQDRTEVKGTTPMAIWSDEDWKKINYIETLLGSSMEFGPTDLWDLIQKAYRAGKWDLGE